MPEQNFPIPNPFAQTALMGDKEENILHITGVRMRVVGAGNLDNILYSMDPIINQSLRTVVMASTNDDEPTILSNFNSQRTMLKVSTDEIDEIFNITRIILFGKPLWTDFPR